MLLQDLQNKKLINPPFFVLSNTMYLTITGSHAYGCADTNVQSDVDICGFCIPSKEIIFAHLAGFIIGFGTPPPKFDQYQQHHVIDQDKVYDITIYSIIRYFHLLMQSNPSLIDTIFVPQECILHITQVGNMIRENRKIFLHKGAFFKYKGFAISQLHKMNTKNPQGKRKEIKDQYGYEVKYAMHLVRLLSEIEQILIEGDLDLRRNSEHLKAIRRGEVKETDIIKWAAEKEIQLEKLYVESKLPAKPDEQKIKNLLLNCLENHYGNLSNCIVLPDAYKKTLLDIREIIDKTLNNT